MRITVTSWLRRGEYFIGMSETGREVALIRTYPEPEYGRLGRKEYDGHGRPVYYDRHGRVIV